MKRKSLSKLWNITHNISGVSIIVGALLFILGGLFQNYHYILYGSTLTLISASVFTVTDSDVFGLSNIRYGSLLLYLSCLLLIHSPVTITTPDTEMKPNTTYITFSDDCPYCQISKSNMTRAVRMFNLTHSNVKIVNISSNSNLAKELNKHIQSQGVILKTQKSTKEFNQVTYPLMDAEGKPKEASSEYIYELLVEYSNK